MNEELAEREKGYVYFCQGKTTGLVKIGWALDPIARVDSFRCGSPEELDLLAAIPGGRDLEAAFHKVWAALRVRGEWFWPIPSLGWHIGRADAARILLEDWGDEELIAKLRTGRTPRAEPFDVYLEREVPRSLGIAAMTLPA